MIFLGFLSLFPAYAGVIPVRLFNVIHDFPFPRACGGDPYLCMGVQALLGFSPRMRG